MLGTKQVVHALKKVLKAKGISYKELAKKLDLSEPSIKRIFSEEDFSLSRLEKICEAIGMNFFELMQAALSSTAINRQELSVEQEEFLCRSSDNFTFFHLLLQGETVQSICKKHAITDVKKTKILLELEKAGLLELHTENKVKLLVSRSIRWIPDGPLKRKNGDRLRNQFFQSTFKEPDELLRMVSTRLSLATQVIIQRKTKQLIREIEEMCSLEDNTDDLPDKAFNILIAYRPMKMDLKFR